MPYTQQQVNSLEDLIKNSVCRNLNAGLRARTVTYNPDDTRNSITKIIFEISFTNGEVMEIDIEFDVASNGLNVNYISSTITDIYMLSQILQDMCVNLRIYENTIIDQFVNIIPRSV